MIVDASALIAMLTDEDEARILAARLQASPKRLATPQARRPDRPRIIFERAEWDG